MILLLIILVVVAVGVMKLCGIEPPKWLWSFDSFNRRKGQAPSSTPMMVDPAGNSRREQRNKKIGIGLLILAMVMPLVKSHGSPFEFIANLFSPLALVLIALGLVLIFCKPKMV